MSPRPSALAGSLIGLLVLAFAACVIDASQARPGALAQAKVLAARLGLTDLALFTEARYTRHPSQADLHSAFQDHPLALEHFPSGALIAPPHEDLVRETAPSD